MCLEDILCLVYGNRWSRIQREFVASFFVAFVFGLVPLFLVILFNDEENLREEGEAGSRTGSHNVHSDNGRRLGNQSAQSQSSRKTLSETGQNPSRITTSSKVSSKLGKREEEYPLTQTTPANKGSTNAAEATSQSRATGSKRGSGSSKLTDSQYHTRSTVPSDLNDRALAATSSEKQSQGSLSLSGVSKVRSTESSLKESTSKKHESDSGFFATPKKFPYLYPSKSSLSKQSQNVSKTSTKSGQQEAKSDGHTESVHENSLNFSNSSPPVDAYFTGRLIDPFAPRKDQNSSRHLRAKVDEKRNEKRITFAKEDQFTENSPIIDAGERHSNKRNEGKPRRNSGYRRPKRVSDRSTNPTEQHIRNEEVSILTSEQHAKDQFESKPLSNVTTAHSKHDILNEKSTPSTSISHEDSHTGSISYSHTSSTKQNASKEKLNLSTTEHANRQTASRSRCRTRTDTNKQKIENRKIELPTSKYHEGSDNGLCSVLHNQTTPTVKIVLNEGFRPAVTELFKDRRKPCEATHCFEEEVNHEKRNLPTHDHNADSHTKSSSQFQISKAPIQECISNKKSNITNSDRLVDSQTGSSSQPQSELATYGGQPTPKVKTSYCAPCNARSSTEKSSLKEKCPDISSNLITLNSSSSTEKCCNVSSNQEQIKIVLCKGKGRVDSFHSESVKSSSSNGKRRTISKETRALKTDVCFTTKSKEVDKEEKIAISILAQSDRNVGTPLSKRNIRIKDIACEKSISDALKLDTEEHSFPRNFELIATVEGYDYKNTLGSLKSPEPKIEPKQSANDEPKLVSVYGNGEQQTLEPEETRFLENFGNTLGGDAEQTQRRVSSLTPQQSCIPFPEIDNKECVKPDAPQNNDRLDGILNSSQTSFKEISLENKDSNLVFSILDRKKELAIETLLRDLEFPKHPADLLSGSKKGYSASETARGRQLPVVHKENTQLEGIAERKRNTNPFLETSRVDEINVKINHPRRATNPFVTVKSSFDNSPQENKPPHLLDKETLLKNNNPFLTDNIIASLKSGVEILPNLALNETEILNKTLHLDKTKTTQEKFVQTSSPNHSDEESKKQTSNSVDLESVTQDERVCREFNDGINLSETYLDTAACSSVVGVLVYSELNRPCSKSESVVNIAASHDINVTSGSYSNLTTSDEKLPPKPVTPSRTISQISFGVFAEEDEYNVEKGHEEEGREEKKGGEKGREEEEETHEAEYSEYEIGTRYSYSGANFEIDNTTCVTNDTSNRTHYNGSVVVTDSTSEGSGKRVIIGDDSLFYFTAPKNEYVCIPKERIIDIGILGFLKPAVKTSQSSVSRSEKIAPFLPDTEENSFHSKSEYSDTNTTAGRTSTNYSGNSCSDTTDKTEANTTREDSWYKKFPFKGNTLTQKPSNYLREETGGDVFKDDPLIRRFFSCSPRTKPTLSGVSDFCSPRRLGTRTNDSETTHNSYLDSESNNKEEYDLIPETKLQLKRLLVSDVQTYKSYTIHPKPMGPRTKLLREPNRPRSSKQSETCTWSDIAKTKS